MMKIQNIFLIIAFIVCSILLVIVPPFVFVPDEKVHFVRAYALSDGIFIPKKDINNEFIVKIPKSVSDFDEQFNQLNDNKTSFNKYIKNYLFLKYDSSKKTDAKLNATTSYSPVCYITQTIGIMFAKMFSNSINYLFFFGRFYNFIAYIFLLYFSIKNVPKYKMLVFLIGLIPMNLLLATSFSPDGMLIGVSILFMSLILKYLSIEKQNIRKGEISLLSFLSAILALIKYNVLLPFFIFLVPKEKFGEKYFFKIFLILFPAMILTLVWTLNIPFVPSEKAGENLMPYEQLIYIIQHPVVFTSLIFEHLSDFYKLCISFFGFATYTFVILPFSFYLVYLFLLFISPVIENRENTTKYNVNGNKKTFWGLLIISYIVSIYIVIYLTFNNYGQTTILGIQARYFLPIALPFFAFISTILPTIRLSSRVFSLVNITACSFAIFYIFINLYMIYRNYFYI